MSKRVHLSDSEPDDDHQLRILIEKFIRKSEELERRESKVLKQVELMQSAVASLQTWNPSPQSPQPPPDPTTSSEPLHIDLNKIEEETREIREETERIQREVRQKIEENKRLQEAIERRNTMLSRSPDHFVTDSFLRALESKEIESRARKPGGHSKVTYDPGIDYFNEKLYKLQQLEKKVRKEMAQDSEEAKRKKKVLTEKIAMLEKESHLAGRSGSSVKKQTANRK